MKHNTCDTHKTPRQWEYANSAARTLEQKRRNYKIGDRVEVTEDYRKMHGGVKGLTEDTSDEFDNGRIVDFKDPYDWELNAFSIASVELPCGCIRALNVAHMK